MKHIHPVVKIIVVTILATYVTYLLGITNYLTAGIVAMISIQKTKRLSINIAGKRLVYVALSLILSSLLFLLIGYNLVAYSIFIIVIVFSSTQLNFQEGIIPSVVVVTHLFVLCQHLINQMLTPNILICKWI